MDSLVTREEISSQFSITSSGPKQSSHTCIGPSGYSSPHSRQRIPSVFGIVSTLPSKVIIKGRACRMKKATRAMRLNESAQDERHLPSWFHLSLPQLHSGGLGGCWRAVRRTPRPCNGSPPVFLTQSSKTVFFTNTAPGPFPLVRLCRLPPSRLADAALPAYSTPSSPCSAIQYRIILCF